MKKIISLSLVLMLLLGILAVPAMADEILPVGQLSYLNMTEKDGTQLSSIRSTPAVLFLFMNGVMEFNPDVNYDIEYHYFDDLNGLVSALGSAVKAISLPYYTAKYLCATNSEITMAAKYYPEKHNAKTRIALNIISDGYSFMMKEENAALRDEFDAQITAMKEDGTLQKLIDEHIVKVSEGGEPVAVDFEQFEGEPIKIGVTGDLPPMDYVAPDGSFAGFNTAVLAEIGKRLQRNIELVQVSSVARALALSEGRVDVVFWTRGATESSGEYWKRVEGLSDEERYALAMSNGNLTDREKSLLGSSEQLSEEARVQYDNRDMPEDTIITQPYFSDFSVLVVLKGTL